ncbi:methionyl-tRNA formyltransferase [Cryptococcus sp. DSM 104548]
MPPNTACSAMKLARQTLRRASRRPAWRLFSASCAGRAETEPFRILFCGSDDFSVASLEAVHNAKDLWSSIDVVVPTEREVGRGGRHAHHHTYTPALRQYAEKNNLPLSTVPFTGLKTWSPPAQFLQPSSPLNNHILLTASFGHIIPTSLLSLFAPTHRLNVHPSLLPRWRGAAPVQWTIAEGDTETGVSVQTLVRYGLGVDAGDIVGRVYGVTVPEKATYQSLLPHLALMGGDLLVDVLRQLRTGTATFTPQNTAHITQAPKITHTTSQIHFPSQSAIQIDRLHRAIGHQHPLWAILGDTTVQLVSISAVDTASLPETFSPPAPLNSGVAVLHKEGKARRLFVACKDGTWLEVKNLKTAGKKVLGVKDWWNGLPKDVRESGVTRFG